MPRTYLPFKFKQFEIHQDKTAMKVGTDGVLLGAWTDPHGKHILDIGTGTGLIALMLAQRNQEAKIDAIDIDPQAIDQARKNFNISPWPDRLDGILSDINDFYPDCKYDLIVSNPPYFINSTLPPVHERKQARHTHSMSYENILSAANRLLSENGKLSVILPAVEGTNFIEFAKTHSLFPERITEFYPRSEKTVERLLVTFGFSKSEPETNKLVHYKNEKDWSEEYIFLTREFYLYL